MAKKSVRRVAPPSVKQAAKKAATSQRPNWLMMVYMQAGDTPGLDAVAVHDLREMERGVNENVEVIVQMNRNWPDAPLRFHIARRGSQVITRPLPAASQNTNMGTKEALGEFLKIARRHDAKRYCLVLWGHAYGLGFGRDHDDALTLENLRKALSSQNGKKLDLLGANACAMSYAEAAYELRGATEYLVASEIAVPLAGWPYETILKCITKDTTSEQLGTVIADAYVSHFNSSLGGERVAMTLSCPPRAVELKEDLTTLADALHAAVRSGGTASQRLMHLRSAFRTTAFGDVRPVIDLKSLCEEIGDLCDDLKVLEGKVLTDLKNAADRLKRFVTPQREETVRFVSTVPPVTPQNRTRKESLPFVVFHKRHSDLDGLHGMGIFAPFVSTDNDLRRLGLLNKNGHNRRGNHDNEKDGRSQYEHLELVMGTNWPRLVYDDLRQEISAETLSGLDQVGIVRPADRSAVANMFASIDGAFQKLSRSVAVSRERLRRILEKKANGRSTRNDGWSGTVVGRLRSLRLQEQDIEAWWGGLAKEGNGNNGQLSAVAKKQVAPGLDEMISSFDKVERALAALVKGTRNSLIHSQFGLGPPKDTGTMGPPKDTGTMGPPKDTGTMGPPKDTGTMGPPKDTGTMGPPKDTGTMGPNGQTMVELTGLFRTVADAMLQLQAATRTVERATAAALTGASRSYVSKNDRDYAALTPALQAFDALDETCELARATVMRVLSDPTYGLGPGLELSVADRQTLADLGGVTTRQLGL
jgi:hypothetical protein